jgi:hypothetical protein
MADIDFPDSPTINDTFTVNNRTWVYVGNDVWNTVETGTIAGPTGPQGDQGPANVLTIGSVTSTIYDEDAEVEITGFSPDQTLNFVLREGPTGPPTSISLGTIDSTDAGGTGAASITGPAGAQVLSLTLPRGPTGPETTISVSNTTGLPGTNASVSVTGPAGNQLVSFVIPQGPTGPEGNWNITGPTAPTAPAGQDGNGWFSSETGRFYIYYDGAWVEVTSNKIGPTGPTGPQGDPTLSVSPVTLTSNQYTIANGDQSKLLRVSNGSTASTIFVPTDATFNFAIGTQINFINEGTGSVTFTASTPATTTIRATPSTLMRTQYSGVTLVKLAANLWWLSGDLA